MKRALVALLAGAAVFASVFGFAAALTVTTNNLAAGDEVVVECDTDGVNVAYTTAWSGANQRFDVASVTVEDIDGCDGETLQVQLVDDDGDSLGGSTGTGQAVSGSADASVTFTAGSTLDSNVSAELVDGVHVVIAGGPAAP